MFTYGWRITRWLAGSRASGGFACTTLGNYTYRPTAVYMSAQSVPLFFRWLHSLAAYNSATDSRVVSDDGKHSSILADVSRRDFTFLE